ncbi:hypothetical protein QYF36_009929 [Acer negundo]|nr:hypothetical protein QYF36_009929 [Acer negundo]
MSSNSKSNPRTIRTQSSPTPFKPGTHIEISIDDVKFRGSWYLGKIVHHASSKDPTKFWVEYTHLFPNEAGNDLLQEIVNANQLRPNALRAKEREFKFGEEVTLFTMIEFGKEYLRLYREWICGEWKPLLEVVEEEEDNENEKKRTLGHTTTSTPSVYNAAAAKVDHIPLLSNIFDSLFDGYD